MPGNNMLDNTVFVNMVQDANNIYGCGIRNTVLMRYPCGRIGLWSVNQGEIVDVLTRGVILYPCIDTVVNKDNSDWRDSFSGDPSMMTITYKNDVATKGSSVDLTVTPNISIYRYHFAAASNYRAVTILANELGIAGANWSNNSFTKIDNQTIQVTISNNNTTIYFYIKFSVPFTGYGTVNESKINEGASSINGDDIGGYVKYDNKTDDMVVAVAMSHTSINKAQTFFTEEFGTMDFNAAVIDLKNAWITTLGRVEATSSDVNVLKEFYTALYSVYAVMVDAVDQPYYAPYNSNRLLTIGSSDYWQYITGYARCEWDMARQTYPLLALIDPEVYKENINAIQAQFNRDGQIYCNWHVFAGNGGGTPAEYTGHEATLAYLLGIPDGVGGIDYNKLLSSIKTHIANNYTSEFWNDGYIPTDHAVSSNPTSHSLEQYATLKGIGIFAKILGDTAAYHQYYPYHKKYITLWKPDILRIVGRNKAGEWVDQGYFEGDGVSYRFMVPQDPYGILNLHVVDYAVSLIDSYVKTHDYNDYKLNYEFLPIFADRADVTQDLVKNVHLPRFTDEHFNMYEGLWPADGLNGQGAFYTGNAGPLAACILGLWYTHTSGGTYLITSPSLDSYVIHGLKDLTVQVNKATPTSHHISAIQLDGHNYPCFQLSALTLGACNHILNIDLVDHPVRLGALYLSSSDGEVTVCTGDLSTYLDFTIHPLASFCSGQVYCTVQPTSITVNGKPFTDWIYDSSRHIATLNHITEGSYHVSVSGGAPDNPPGPIPPPAPPPPSGISMEAENMALINYTVINNVNASNGNLIKLSGQGVTGTATYTFSGSNGVYNLNVRYLSENDGACIFRFYVAGKMVDEWTPNQNPGNEGAANYANRIKKGVYIYNNALIKLEAVQKNHEYGLYDNIEVTPVGVSVGTYEMENGTIGGSASIYSSPAASFGAHVGFLHITGASVTVNNVDGGTGGKKTMVIQYATQEPRSSIDLYINGSFSQTITFSGTGGWEKFQTTTTNISLIAGSGNSIKFIHNSDNSGGVNLDKIIVQSSGK